MDEYDIEKAFKAIEDELMASMIRNMRRHRLEEIDEKKEWTMWQAEQLKALEGYKKENRKKFESQFSNIDKSIDSIIREARAEGSMEQEIKILEAIKKGFATGNKRRTGAASVQTTGEFFKLNNRKLEALIKATQNDFKKAERAMLRMADDQYRKVIFNAQVYANTGAGTYEQAVDMATRDFLDRGLNCIEYANGARHTVADYAFMAIQTAGKRAYLTGEGEMRQKWGIHTVIMNKRENACPKCIPFVGKVLIDDVWSGGKQSDGPYLLMSNAMAAGLYHPRCKDVHTTYFQGISKHGAVYTKKERQQVEEAFRREQKQQNAKRQTERFERLEKYSLDENNRKLYKQRKQTWEEQLQDLIDNNKDFDIIDLGMVHGALTDANDPLYTKRNKHAEKYYEAVRNSEKLHIVKAISENTGISEKKISKIYDHVFINKYNLYGGHRRFDPDYDMAESFRRLRNGKDIQEHDLIMLKHEYLEYGLMNKAGMPYKDAHRLAESKYNYAKALMEFKEKRGL